MWMHSRDEHGGRMREEDWQSSILSTHTKALNRQVTEAVLISEKGGGGRTVRLLNSKQEFGANLMLEVVVMRGHEVLGKRNTKRKQEEQVRRGEAREEARGPAEGQGGPPVGGGEEAQTTTTPPPPKRRRREEEEFPTTGMVGVEGATKAPVDYSSWTLKDLKSEMKVRRMKPGSRDREELVRDLLREDKSQGRIS